MLFAPSYSIRGRREQVQRSVQKRLAIEPSYAALFAASLVRVSDAVGAMDVCEYCGTVGEQDKYHPGCCGNCGAPYTTGVWDTARDFEEYSYGGYVTTSSTCATDYKQGLRNLETR